MKTMMLSITVVLFFVSNVFSECKDYEFTDLNKMTEQQLVSAYEENLNAKYKINEEALEKKVTSELSSDVRKKVIACDKYNDKISRAFKNKFPGKNLRKPPANRY
jgi:hypothetical protein